SVAVRLQEDLSSDRVTAGQSVAAVVSEAVKVGGRTVIPAGAHVKGRVAEVKPAKRFGGQASLVVQFDEVLLPSGGSIDVEGQMVAQARKETGRDAAKIGGGAAAGAFLGKVLGHKRKTTRRGALLGAAVGTAAASKKGDEAFIAAGSEALVMTLTRASVRAG
ncbi:MAG: glycine zipper 2TM domain-containing protein, partial [Acidobacteriota bacterium]